MLDRKTGEMVQLLFAYRGRMTGKEYINVSLIPSLCRKAGVPESDVRGDITSHRARSTIASQLFNAREPMSLFELQAWLGHSSPHTTQFYANVTPTKLAQAYAETEYFKRNVRTITVLIDRESIKNGAAAQEAFGDTLTWGMGTAPMSFLISVLIAWPARDVHSISRRFNSPVDEGGSGQSCTNEARNGVV